MRRHRAWPLERTHFPAERAEHSPNDNSDRQERSIDTTTPDTWPPSALFGHQTSEAAVSGKTSDRHALRRDAQASTKDYLRAQHKGNQPIGSSVMLLHTDVPKTQSFLFLQPLGQPDHCPIQFSIELRQRFASVADTKFLFHGQFRKGLPQGRV
jgi:hypothetical protein